MTNITLIQFDIQSQTVTQSAIDKLFGMTVSIDNKLLLLSPECRQWCSDSINEVPRIMCDGNDKRIWLEFSSDNSATLFEKKWL